MKNQLKSMTQRRSGFIGYSHNRPVLTVIEMLVTLSIIFVVAAVTMGIFGNGLQAVGKTKYITAGAYAAKEYMEDIKDTPFQSITTQYPDQTSYPALGTSLPGGTWTISYRDGIISDPLEVLISVSWVENGTPQSVQLTTQLSPQ